MAGGGDAGVVLFHHAAEMHLGVGAQPHGVEGAQQQLVGLRLDDDAAAGGEHHFGLGHGQLLEAALLELAVAGLAVEG